MENDSGSFRGIYVMKALFILQQLFRGIVSVFRSWVKRLAPIVNTFWR